MNVCRARGKTCGIINQREKYMKLYEIHKQMKKLSNDAEDIPWGVWTCFWESKPSIDIGPDYFLLEGDSKNLEEMRDGVEWLVKQFGGTVKWKK